MERLSKTKIKARSNFTFKEEEVELPEIGGSVLVRSPSVETRDEMAKHAPDDQKDWDLKNTAYLFSKIVVDPQVTPEEAEEFLGDWPGEALDRVLAKFTELIGTKEETRAAVGQFPSKD